MRDTTMNGIESNIRDFAATYAAAHFWSQPAAPRQWVQGPTQSLRTI